MIQRQNSPLHWFQPGFRVAERPDGPGGEDATLEALPRRINLDAEGRHHRILLPRLPPLCRTIDIRVALRVQIRTNCFIELVGQTLFLLPPFLKSVRQSILDVYKTLHV